LNKKIALAMFFTLILFFSISAIHASDVNLTDYNTVNSCEGISLQLENEVHLNDLEHVGSEGLSTSFDDAYLKENNENQTELISPTTSAYMNGRCSVTLKDSSTNAPLVNKNINFVINNVKYPSKTNKDGVASVNLAVDPGTYEVTASFSGDSSHGGANITFEIEVLPTIKANDITKYYKGSTKYSATFVDSKGNPLKNKKVTIKVNGKSYTKKTNSKGIVSLPINLKPGVYKVVSTNPVTGYKLTTNFKILSTIVASDLKKVAGDSNKFVVKFLKSNGKPLAKQYVKLKINGKVHKVRTNSKGIVYFSLKSFKQGTYKIISYNKDGLSKSNQIKIYKISYTQLSTNFYTFSHNDTKMISVRFSNSLGESSNSGKTIDIEIDGVIYSKKTDSKGMVYLDLSSLEKGLYHVEYSYGGSKYFKAVSARNFVTILGTNTDPELSVESITDFGYGASTPLEVAFSAGGVPLVNRNMTFTVDGKSYTKITDEWGIASLPIDLKVGNHTVKYRTYDELYVNGTSGSCSITVFKRSETKLTWECGLSYKDSSQSFKVLLTDFYGNPIPDQLIELTIDGETYIDWTGSNGYAKFTTDVALGKYNVLVKFLGTNDYADSSISSSINVELSKFGKGLNVKDSSYYSSAYLKSTRHCQVNNAKIKSLVKSLTKGLTNDVDKAKAIFNYVRDNIAYSYYYNSKLGAVGTLNAKKGNCVDQSHLLVAMYRAAGFKARYVHGKCEFGDGVYGHVWTQVLVKGTWLVGDPINSNNALGKISNWDTRNYKLKNRYISLPF